MVEQPTRRGNHDVDAALDLRDLRARTDTAVNLHATDRAVLAIDPHALVDLSGELTRGRQDQCAHLPPARWRVLEQLQHGQREGGCLAGAGLGAGEDVVAFEDVGDGFALDRGRCFIALFVDSTQQVGRKAEVVK